MHAADFTPAQQHLFAEVGGAWGVHKGCMGFHLGITEGTKGVHGSKAMALFPEAGPQGLTYAGALWLEDNLHIPSKLHNPPAPSPFCLLNPPHIQPHTLLVFDSLAQKTLPVQYPGWQM